MGLFGGFSGVGGGCPVGVLGVFWTRVVGVDLLKRGLFLSFWGVFGGLFYKV